MFSSGIVTFIVAMSTVTRPLAVSFNNNCCTVPFIAKTLSSVVHDAGAPAENQSPSKNPSDAENARRVWDEWHAL